MDGHNSAALMLWQDQSSLPSFGSKPRILPLAFTTSSSWPSTFTIVGVFHDAGNPVTLHTVLPVLRSSASNWLLSCAAFTMSRSPYKIGEEPTPQSCAFSPTLTSHTFFPSTVKACTPAFPMKK